MIETFDNQAWNCLEHVPGGVCVVDNERDIWESRVQDGRHEVRIIRKYNVDTRKWELINCDWDEASGGDIYAPFIFIEKEEFDTKKDTR